MVTVQNWVDNEQTSSWVFFSFNNGRNIVTNIQKK